MAEEIAEGMDIIATDGVRIGTVDQVEKGRIKLKKHNSIWKNKKHHHYIEMSFVDHVAANQVRLSTTSDIIATMEEESSDKPLKL